MTIRILATGGTIASRLDPATGAVVPAVSPEDLVAAVAGIEEHGPVEVEELARVNGWNVTPDVMVNVAERARAALAEGVDGVVITHGTDTTEETLYLVDLLAGDATDAGGIVVACAMRSAGEVGADGPRNLLNAARIATHPDTRGRGALLSVNDEIHAARWVTKTDTTNVSTFRSPPPGAPVGRVVAGAPRYDRDSPPRPPHGDRIEPAVALVKAYTGMDGALLRWLVDEQQIRGLVVEGTGAGNVPGPVAEGIDHALANDVAVVIASRCWTGRPEPIYGGPGGGVTLAERGVIRSNGLNGPKARLALMVALGCCDDHDELERWFADA